MIRLEQPSIALNDFRGGARYHMWRTWDALSEHTTRERIIREIRNLAQGVSNGGRVIKLVIGGHGSPGHLHVGEGFTNSHLQMFASWRGLFSKIWLMGCLVGRNVNTPAHFEGTTYQGDGSGFCSELAVITGADVAAATEIQVTRPRTYPYGFISMYEGLYCLFQGGTGEIVELSRNRSHWRDSRRIHHGAGETW